MSGKVGKRALYPFASVSEIVMVGAQGVLLDQGQQAVRVGTSDITLLVAGSQKMAVKNGSIIMNVDSDANPNLLKCLTLSSGENMQSTYFGVKDTGTSSTSYSWISSSRYGSGYNNLCLQSEGGNVGIGITAPTSKLTILGSTAMGAAGVPENTSTELIQAWLRPGTAGVQNAASFGITLGAQSASIDSPGKVYFQVSSSATAANIWGNTPDKVTMTLTGDGNVGIGTVSNGGNARLDVRSAGDGSSTANWITALFGASNSAMDADRVVMGSYQGRAIIGAHNGAVTAWRGLTISCLLYTSPSPRDRQKSRMPSSA